MKTITRTVKVYTYTFANFNEDFSIKEVEKVVSSERIKERELVRLTKEKGKVLLDTKSEERTYSLSLERFISMAEEEMSNSQVDEND